MVEIWERLTSPPVREERGAPDWDWVWFLVLLLALFVLSQRDKWPEWAPGADGGGKQIDATAPLTTDDPFWDIVGLGHTEGPTDLSENMDAYLAQVYRAESAPAQDR
jgi:hypothetical protein